MSTRPHVDILDSAEELSRVRERKPAAVSPVMRFDAARRLNGLADRHIWATNVLLRIYRGTGPDNGWRDGDFRMAFTVGPNQYRPASVLDAAPLYNRLKNGIWAAYLLEETANIELVGSEKEKRLIRRPLESGGFEQFQGRDWTKADEARRLFTELSLPEVAFRAWFQGVRKPVRVAI